MSRDIPELIRLLWRHEIPVAPARGRPARISVDDLVAAGIAIADADGLAAVTMRAVAARLGTGPMSLYAHVPDKTALLALMSDRVLAAMRHADYDRIDDWRERLERLADDNRAVLLEHAWLAAGGPDPMPVGPGAITKYERELRALDRLGLPPVDTDACLTLIVDFARSSAVSAVAASAPDADWWQEAGPALAEHVVPERFPLATSIGAAAGEEHGSARDDEHAWRFGLARILDGIASLAEGPPIAPDMD
ncbi:TetR family transcriptional regulator [Agromyces luteolus]|uniref:TetR family transcriptional regulator n=1 Tax=Agromyces luteolus TaxID=88373 RepID=A0A7C9HPP5_9MICO|nr:TetR/AcrR family transcriptional regulator C-terminal domain-containing protein [Agromyces luteolus]MUN06209.1 TetR family transcriptional regulator [Agromyces luteolus]GLK26762.1 TetR family transcriptional regulator [Agromyces luteolus]